MLAFVIAAALVTPLSIRAMNRVVVGIPPGRGYLPSLELSREHVPFRTRPIEDLRYGRPAWVFIGDSMLGTRIDPVLLGEISSTHDENVGMLVNPATGPAWWYLAFKNYLIASGVKPRVVFVLFRDTNLTDTMFRLESLYGNVLDEAAHADEPELDEVVGLRRQGLWSRVHSTALRIYEADVATRWLEPGLRRWFVNWRFPDPSARMRFDRLLNERFDLATLRGDVAADLSGPNEASDFVRDVPTSVLPLMIDLATQHDVPLCFVRVQRRPRNTTAPAQSPNLLRYVGDLKAYLSVKGMLFHDDWGDPELPESIYADGDHVRDRRHYTTVFRRRLDPLFR